MSAGGQAVPRHSVSPPETTAKGLDVKSLGTPVGERQQVRSNVFAKESVFDRIDPSGEKTYLF